MAEAPVLGLFHAFLVVGSRLFYAPGYTGGAAPCAWGIKIKPPPGAKRKAKKKNRRSLWRAGADELCMQCFVAISVLEGGMAYYTFS